MSPAAIDALAGLPAASRDAAGRLALVAIGPTTAAHAASLGWPVRAIAASPDAAAACEAVAVALAR
jgi:uroporphyrinogen-III synthase